MYLNTSDLMQPLWVFTTFILIDELSSYLRNSCCYTNVSAGPKLNVVWRCFVSAWEYNRLDYLQVRSRGADRFALQRLSTSTPSISFSVYADLNTNKMKQNFHCLWRGCKLFALATTPFTIIVMLITFLKLFFNHTSKCA